MESSSELRPDERAARRGEAMIRQEERRRAAVRRHRAKMKDIQP
jgi:hypothetical protein